MTQPPVAPLHCGDVERLLGVRFSCCDSCHEDEEWFGFDLLDATVNGQDAAVCCAASYAIEAAGRGEGP